MQRFNPTPREIAASAWRNRSLIWALTVREILGRYKGSALGLFWSFVTPVLMLVVYTFVFSVVFKARWNGADHSKSAFALVLFAGLMVFNLFGECVTRAPGLIIANANYVKKVVFPLEVLPLVAVASALFHLLVSLLVWLVAYVALIGIPPVTALLLPIVLLPLLLLAVGTSWLLASLGVFFRDINQIIGILITALMFLSPIFFPASALPQDYQVLLLLNPLTPIIESVRAVLIFGQFPDWSALGLNAVLALLVGCLGFAWFQKTRKGFADVL